MALVDDYVNTVVDVIRFNLEHEDYQAVMEKELFCHQMTTGEDQMSLLEMVTNLKGEQLKALDLIYRPHVPYALKPQKDTYSRMYRVDNNKSNSKHPNETLDVLITRATSKFYEGRTVEHFIEKKLVNMNFEHPNDVLMIERKDHFDPFSNEKVNVTVYPLIIPAQNITNWAKDETNELKWILAEFTRKELIIETDAEGTVDRKEGMEVTDYYFYAAGLKIVFTEFSDLTVEEVMKSDPDDSKSKVYDIIEITPKGSSIERKFVIEVWDTGCKEFAGIHFGAFGESIRLPPYDEIRHLLLDLVAHKAEKDLQERKHIFQKLLTFIEKCDSCDEWGKTAEGNKCKTCGGEGYHGYHRNSMDIIEVIWPKTDDAKKQLGLEDRFHYIDIPVESVEYYGKQVNEDIKKISIGMFGVVEGDNPNPLQHKTALASKQETATQNNIIFRMAEHHSKMWMKIYRIAGQYVGAGLDYEPEHAFDKDLDLKTLRELFSEKALAKEGGANAEILWSIDRNILKKLNTNNPEEVQKANLIRAHTPFISLSYEEALTEILQRDPKKDIDRFIFFNRDRLFQVIFDEHTDFYLIQDFKPRDEIVRATAKRLMEEAEYVELPEPEAFNDGGFQAVP